jgi:glutamate-ammonia-ligase adenylyltransferase
MSAETPHELPGQWQPALTHSRFLRQLLGSRPAVTDWLAENAAAPISAATMQAFIDNAHPADDSDLKAALRHLRQRVMAALVVRDIGGQASLAEVVETMTALADVTTNYALDFMHRQLAVRRAARPAGQPQRLLIDRHGQARRARAQCLLRRRPTSSSTPRTARPPAAKDGGRKIDNYDFFTRLGKRLINALGESPATARSSASTCACAPMATPARWSARFDSLENYFITQGREWERYAWIKARVMNEGDNLQRRAGRALKHRAPLRLPQVPRLRRHQRHARPARADPPRGGAQGHGRQHQARPRRHPRDRVHRPGVPVDPRRPRPGAADPADAQGARRCSPTRRLLPADATRELAAAYDSCAASNTACNTSTTRRRTCCRPPTKSARQIAARWVSPTGRPAGGSRRLIAPRVARHFEQVFADPEAGTHAWPACGWEQDAAATKRLELAETGLPPAAERARTPGGASARATLPAAAAGNRERWTPSAAPDRGRGGHQNPDATWQRGLDFLETISRRGAYLALLQQYPQALSKVAELIGSASWAADYLNRTRSCSTKCSTRASRSRHRLGRVRAQRWSAAPN